MRRAQIALEYVFVHGFALLLLIGLLVTLLYVENQAREDVRIEQSHDIASQIQKELVIASSVHDGYRREFLLPNTIGSHYYSVELAETAVFVHLDGYQAIASVPEATGNITPGLNIITKVDGEVMIQ